MFVSAKALDVTYPPIPPKAPSQVQDLALKTLSTEEKKTVSFNDEVTISLIPTKEVYLEDGSAQNIWWIPEDLNKIKLSMLTEIEKFKQHFPNLLSNRQVIALLYQPNLQTIDNTQTNAKKDS